MGDSTISLARRRLLGGHVSRARNVAPAANTVTQLMRAAGTMSAERFAALVLNRLAFGPKARRLRSVVNVVDPDDLNWQFASGATRTIQSAGIDRINFSADTASRAFVLNTNLNVGESIQVRMELRGHTGSGRVRLTSANGGGTTVNLALTTSWRKVTWNGSYAITADSARGFALRRSTSADALDAVRVRFVNLHRLGEMSDPRLAEYIPYSGVALFPFDNATSVASNTITDQTGAPFPPGDIATFIALGASNEQRLQAWLALQLAPQSIDDSHSDTLLAHPRYETLSKTQTQLWSEHQRNATFSIRVRPRDEGERAFVVRAMHSRRQMLETAVDFWHNHFSVFNDTDYARSLWPSWDRDVIRTHAFGNFRQFIGATSRHPAMLRYLDNYRNQVSGPNENYARELIELHTLGAENYFGVIQQNEVPIIPPGQPGEGLPAGYCDADVYEATRCMTGWGVADGHQSAPDTGAFLYRESWHDRFQKNVLGTFFAADGAPLADGETLLDLLANHPGTARYIAGRMCRRFISDQPPQAVINAVAKAFYDHRNEPDQLRRVFERMVLYTGLDDPETGFSFVPGCFSDSDAGAQKMKRPLEVVIGSVRAGASEFHCRYGESTSNDLMNRLTRTGQRPFSWRPPDGFPDRASFWQGSTVLVQSWRTVDWLIDRNLDGRTQPCLPVLQITEIDFSADPNDHTPNNLADFWLGYLLGWAPDAVQGWRGTALHDKIARFMARPSDAGVSPWNRDFPIGTAGQPGIGSNSGPNYWYPRLRGMVALILSSPEFMQR